MEGGWVKGGADGPAVEKYSRFLQPPLPVSAGHDCDGKPGTKPQRENSFSSRPCCFVGFFKGLPYTMHLYCACALRRIGRFGDGGFSVLLRDLPCRRAKGIQSWPLSHVTSSDLNLTDFTGEKKSC